MQIIFSQLINNPNIDIPYEVAGWIGWLLMLAVLLWGFTVQPEKLNKVFSLRWVGYTALVLLVVPIATLFFGIRLPEESALILPGVPVEPSPSVFMLFSAIPWIFAAGILGPFSAALAGFLTGVMIAFWNTHNIFSPLEIAGLALVFSMAVRQRYRTVFFRSLRHPLVAAILLCLVYSPIYMLSAYFNAHGTFAVRFDYAIIRSWPLIVLRGGEVVVAALLAEIFYLSKARFWGRQEPLKPSPAETSLHFKYSGSAILLAIVLLLTLIISVWIVAGNAAQNLIVDRLSTTARIAAESVPYFFEAGQNLITSMAKIDLLNLPPDQVKGLLKNSLRTVAFYRELLVLVDDKIALTGYPLEQMDQIRITQQELAGIRLAFKGVVSQNYVIPPWPGENSVQVSFLAGIRDNQGVVKGVLLGRSDLNSNPFLQPVVQAFEGIKTQGGKGAILDETNQILFHSIPDFVMTNYLPEKTVDTPFVEEISSTGTRQLVYYQAVSGKPWTIVFSLPAEQAQQMSLEIAFPILLVLLVISGIAYFMIRWGLTSITTSLRNLAKEATLIAGGQLDHPLVIKRVDEIGQFSSAFEQMRASLKARLDDLNRLLTVSQGVASNLDTEKSMQYILQAAMVEGADFARVVLISADIQELKPDGFQTYGIGQKSDPSAYLDHQIIELLQQQEVLVIPNTTRVRRLNSPPGKSQPKALIALPIRHEHQFYGGLWVGFDEIHNFSESEVKFFTTLGGEAALAAANTRLYISAEIGRQRLAAVLESTPEPVIVMNEQNQVFLLNLAAMELPGLISPQTITGPIYDVVTNNNVLEFIKKPATGSIEIQEIELTNGKFYLVSLSPVLSDGKPVGKICILRDITHYKELDSLKSDFVSTVSHDLRSPLMLMRGYVTMMQMVGELNDQQKVYITKIITGVETMTHLVNSLLDLGRIEAGIGLRIEKISAVDILDQVVNSLQPQAVQKNIQVDQQIPQQALSFEADTALIQQALYNLVDNAIKYTGVRGRIIVRIHPRSNAIAFEVRDNGIGIAPLDLPHMFEKFYQSNRREAYPQRGAGLGLAIVKSIAERHKGRVWVDSQLGRGSAFFLEIPLSQTLNVVKR